MIALADEFRLSNCSIRAFTGTDGLLMKSRGDGGAFDEDGFPSKRSGALGLTLALLGLDPDSEIAPTRDGDCGARSVLTLVATPD